MKKLLLSASALCALAALSVGSASAADIRLPVKRSAPVVVAPFNWTGVYLGFNLGETKDTTNTQETWVWNYLFPANTVGIDPASNFARGAFGGAYNTGFGNTYRHNSMGFIGGLQWG